MAEFMTNNNKRGNKLKRTHLRPHLREVWCSPRDCPGCSRGPPAAVVSFFSIQLLPLLLVLLVFVLAFVVGKKFGGHGSLQLMRISLAAGGGYQLFSAFLITKFHTCQLKHFCFFLHIIVDLLVSSVPISRKYQQVRKCRRIVIFSIRFTKYGYL